MDANQILLYAFLGAVFLIALVSILGGFLHSRRERLLTHAERMKALELGRELPEDPALARIKATGGQVAASEEEESGLLAQKCYSTALWVAFVGFGAAAGGSSVSSGVGYAIAASAGAIGVTAVICGTILAARAPKPTSPRFASKPETEPDALDVVSCRG